MAIFLFAFSSIIGNYYYGEANIRFITRRPGALTLYRLLVGAMVLFSPLPRSIWRGVLPTLRWR